MRAPESKFQGLIDDTVRLVRDAPLPTPEVTQSPGHCDLTKSNARKLDEMLGHHKVTP